MDSLMSIGERPPIVVLENVVGLLHGGNLNGLCESLAALDMVFGALVVDAKHFLPQSRPRVFVVALDARIPHDEFVLPARDDSPWFPRAVVNGYEHLPPTISKLWRWWNVPTPPDRSISLQSIIEDNPDGVKYHSKKETNRLLKMMADIHVKKVEEAASTGNREIGLIYKRMRHGIQRAEIRFDGLSGCLRTPRGGSSRQIVMIVKGREIKTRLLAPAEAARLMGAETIGFPEGFSYNESYLAMGDGVAVPVVGHLGTHLLTPLAEQASKHLDDWKSSQCARRSGNGFGHSTRNRAADWAARQAGHIEQIDSGME